MVCRIDDGRNLIFLKTAIFLLKDFNRLLVCSCQERLLSIITPIHLHDDLNSINLDYFNYYFNYFF